MGERGLKQADLQDLQGRTKVAPYGGAWIETLCLKGEGSMAEVAPYGGAWIETI